MSWFRCIAVLVAILIATSAIAQGLPTGNARDAYIASTVRACITIQREAPQNAGFAVEKIAVYCTCIANGLADVISTDDVDYFSRGGKATPATVERNRAMGLACLEMGFVQGHWRLNPECETLVRSGRPLTACPSARMMR